MESRKDSRMTACTAVAIFFLMSFFGHAEESGRSPEATGRRGDRMELVMGTLLQISVQAESQAAADKALEAGFKEARRLDDLLSNYKETSEISRINREAYPESTPTTSEMTGFLTGARGLSEETSGYFEIMIEPLTKLWNVRERHLVKMPEKKFITKARYKSSYKHLEIYQSDNTVRFLREGCGVDTGGIGKGYALDKALKKMRASGIQSATLNFGGEILYWPLEKIDPKVAVKDPLEPAKIWETFSIAGFSTGTAAVSTSANYERFITADAGGKNKVLGHLLNPKTGEPVKNGIQSVTALSKDGTRADALSTALFVMGLGEAQQFLKLHPEDWALILYQDSATIKSFSQGGWKKEEFNP